MNDFKQFFKILKKVFISILPAVLILCLSSCQTTTMTDKSNDYLYGLNEEIKILDIESKKELGAVTITDVVILMDSPFELSKIKEHDGNGDPVYENVRYEELVQINYTASTVDSTKKISSVNFDVFDAKFAKAEFDPEMEYTKKDTIGKTLVVALKNKSDYIHIDFKFYITQFDVTAKIKVPVAAQDVPPPVSSDIVPEAPSNNENTDASFSFSNYIHYNQLLIICAVLGCLVIGLLVTVIVMAVRRKGK